MASEKNKLLHLPVFFNLPRDEETYKGIAVNLTRNHITFVTAKPLLAGLELSLTICTDKEGKSCPLQKIGAVVEGHKSKEGGGVIITAKFVPKNVIEDKDNRRSSKRHAVHLPGRLRQGHEKLWSECNVLDISSNGVCFNAKRPLREKCVADIVIFTKEGSPMGMVVRGDIRITRSRHQGGGVYESAGFYETVDTEDPIPADKVNIYFPVLSPAL